MEALQPGEGSQLKRHNVFRSPASVVSKHSVGDLSLLLESHPSGKTQSPLTKAAGESQTQSRRNRWCCSLLVWVNSDSGGVRSGRLWSAPDWQLQASPRPSITGYGPRALTKHKRMILLFSLGFTIWFEWWRLSTLCAVWKVHPQFWKTYFYSVFVEDISELGDFSLLHHSLCNFSHSCLDEWVLWEWRTFVIRFLWRSRWDGTVYQFPT